MKQSIIVAIIIGLISFGIYSGWHSYSNAKNYQSFTQELANMQDLESSIEAQLQQVIHVLSLGLKDNEALIRYQKAKELQLLHKEKALVWTFVSLSMVFLSILIGKLFLRENLYMLVLSICGFFTLILGIFSPIMTLIVKTNINFLGDIVLSFESKSILTTIEKLINQDEWIVGIAIFLFSVLLPLGKIVSLFLVSIWHNMPWTHSLMNFFKKLGKWSMVDVFVVAILLVYLTGAKNDATEAYTGIGLYFFLGYVIISIIASIQGEKMLQKRVL